MGGMNSSAHLGHSFLIAQDTPALRSSLVTNQAVKAEFDDDRASPTPSLPATDVSSSKAKHAPEAAIGHLLRRLPPISTFEVVLHVPLHDPKLPPFRVLGQAPSFEGALELATDAAVDFHSKLGMRTMNKWTCLLVYISMPRSCMLKSIMMVDAPLQEQHIRVTVKKLGGFYDFHSEKVMNGWIVRVML